MPAFVFVKALDRIGEVDGVLCDPGPLGHPDRRTDTPVRVRLSEKALLVDGEPRGIIWQTNKNGMVEFLVGSGTAIRNRARRQQLARASDLLKQLADAIRPLAAGSEEAGLATEGLGLLFEWISQERERATAAPRAMVAEGVHDDHPR